MTWPMTPLKRLVDPTRSITYGIVQAGPDTPGGVPYIRPVDMTQFGGVSAPATLLRTSPEIANAYRRSTVAEGDVVVSIGPSYGKVMVIPTELAGANLTQGTARVAPASSSHGRYLYWVLQSSTSQQFWDSSVGGATFRALNLEPLARTPVPLPSLEEQRRIADFLDAETARIDRLRELREQQKELIREASFRRVYDAIRGAHVEGNRKDSGLEWLGTVPVDWRVGGVSHYFEVELGKMLNQERSHGKHLRPYLRVANVQWDRVDVSNLAKMDFPPEEQVRYRLMPGDLLVNEGGSWPGRAAVWDGDVPEMYYQKALHRVRARGAELPRWLYYCLVVAERLKVFQVQGNTSTMTHLTREQLRPQRFPYPEPDVQRELVVRLDRAASRDLEVRRLLDSQLALLAERRQALITAAVTGQFDVSTASGRNVTDGVTE